MFHAEADVVILYLLLLRLTAVVTTVDSPVICQIVCVKRVVLRSGLENNRVFVVFLVRGFRQKNRRVKRTTVLVEIVDLRYITVVRTVVT